MSGDIIHTHQLDEATYLAVFVKPMKKVTDEADPPLDIWPYVRAVPSVHLGGHEIWDECVECVYRPAGDRYDLVHVCTRTPNVFLVIVVDRIEANIHGHHLLDLNALYGIPLPSPPGNQTGGFLRSLFRSLFRSRRDRRR